MYTRSLNLSSPISGHGSPIFPTLPHSSITASSHTPTRTASSPRATRSSTGLVGRSDRLRRLVSVDMDTDDASVRLSQVSTSTRPSFLRASLSRPLDRIFSSWDPSMADQRVRRSGPSPRGVFAPARTSRGRRSSCQTSRHTRDTSVGRPLSYRDSRATVR
jgi:hypothetical protein